MVAMRGARQVEWPADRLPRGKELPQAAAGRPIAAPHRGVAPAGGGCGRQERRQWHAAC